MRGKGSVTPKGLVRMNYYSEHNKDIRDAVLKLLGGGCTNAKRVNFSVSYSQNRKRSIVVIELVPCSTIHGLIFIYTRSLSLYDAFSYRNKRFLRIRPSGDALKLINQMNKFILSKIPTFSPISLRRIKEESGSSDSGDQLKKQQIQKLKDRNRIEKEVSRGLRNQIKALRDRERRARSH